MTTEVRDALAGIAARASASGKKGEANEITRFRYIPARALKAQLQRMWQAFRSDHLRFVRDEDPSGRAGQKNTRGKWRLLGEMGIARRYAQTSALSPASFPSDEITLSSTFFRALVVSTTMSTRKEEPATLSNQPHKGQIFVA